MHAHNPRLPEVAERKLHKHGLRIETGFAGKPTTRPTFNQLLSQPSPRGETISIRWETVSISELTRGGTVSISELTRGGTVSISDLTRGGTVDQ